ncbi:MAG TPA: hypothetical protein VLX85_03220 [Stellaceae bacterium]|nr:hypothetical protein [Stellaceae bacterium]
MAPCLGDRLDAERVAWVRRALASHPRHWLAMSYCGLNLAPFGLGMLLVVMPNRWVRRIRTKVAPPGRGIPDVTAFWKRFTPRLVLELLLRGTIVSASVWPRSWRSIALVAVAIAVLAAGIVYPPVSGLLVVLMIAGTFMGRRKRK